MLGGGTDVGASWLQYDNSAATQLQLSFSPNLDYFVARNVSIGLDLGLFYTDARGYASDGTVVETKTTDIFAGPRVGLNIPFGSAVSWWLTGAAGIRTTTSSYSDGPGTSRDGPYVSLYLPLLFHPASHFFFGIGPSFTHSFGALQGGPNGAEEPTTIGAGFLVGGYWGGDATAQKPAPTPESSPRSRSHLGEQGQVVFTNELALDLYSTSYAGSSSSYLSGGFAAGFDYFVADHFAVGAGGVGNWTNQTGTDGNGERVHDQYVRTTGAFARIAAQGKIVGPAVVLPAPRARFRRRLLFVGLGGKRGLVLHLPFLDYRVPAAGRRGRASFLRGARSRDLARHLEHSHISAGSHNFEPGDDKRRGLRRGRLALTLGR